MLHLRLCLKHSKADGATHCQDDCTILVPPAHINVLQQKSVTCILADCFMQQCAAN
jgi:hypothetical protein